jgi:hypothetical protein
VQKLTEVHVPGLVNRLFAFRKAAFGVEFSKRTAFRPKSLAWAKYLSKWCSNALALTIYVNANEPRLSQ